MLTTQVNKKSSKLIFCNNFIYSCKTRTGLTSRPRTGWRKNRGIKNPVWPGWPDWFFFFTKTMSFWFVLKKKNWSWRPGRPGENLEPGPWTRSGLKTIILFSSYLFIFLNKLFELLNRKRWACCLIENKEYISFSMIFINWFQLFIFWFKQSYKHVRLEIKFYLNQFF
jgi:hypothetical protein